MSKILIVDDEIQIRSLLARMLELEGYEVCQAGDCKAAVKQLEVQSPDVVLCDVFLPDGNGVDLVLNIKKQAPNVEVILLTYLFGTEGVCHGCSGITYRRDRDRKRGFCSGYPL